ncbi:hypothetical protein BAE44_0003541, partial [Dichanthelium oligosanthes]
LYRLAPRASEPAPGSSRSRRGTDEEDGRVRSAGEGADQGAEAPQGRGHEGHQGGRRVVQEGVEQGQEQHQALGRVSSSSGFLPCPSIGLDCSVLL